MLSKQFDSSTLVSSDFKLVETANQILSGRGQAVVGSAFLLKLFEEDDIEIPLSSIPYGLRDIVSYMKAEKKNSSTLVDTTDPYIEDMNIIVTPKCLGNCAYCYAYRGRDEDKFISVDELRNLIERVPLKLTRRTSVLFGGDAMTHPQLEDVIKTFIMYGFKPSIITGSFVPDFVERVREINQRFGDQVGWTFSLDPDDGNGFYTRGSDILHVGLRLGAGTVWERIVKAMRILGAGNFGIQSTLTRYGWNVYKFVKDLKAFAMAIEGDDSFIPTIIGARPALMVPDEIRMRKDHIIELKQLTDEEFRKPTSGQLLPINRFRWYEGAARDRGLIMNTRGECNSLLNRIDTGYYITEKGEIEWHYAYCTEAGSWQDKRFLFNDPLNLPEFLLKNRYDYPDECKDCEYLGICGCYCTARVPVWGCEEIMKEFVKFYATVAARLAMDKGMRLQEITGRTVVAMPTPVLVSSVE